MGSEAIWRVHFWASVTHCVRLGFWRVSECLLEDKVWGPRPDSRRSSSTADLGLNSQPKHAIANCSQDASLMLSPGKYSQERFFLLPHFFGDCSIAAFEMMINIMYSIITNNKFFEVEVVSLVNKATIV